MEAKRTLSVFVDESGRFQHPDPDSRFYIIGMVFHDQSDDIARQIKGTTANCNIDILPCFVTHARVRESSLIAVCRSSNFLELCRAGSSDFCYTCRAFGRRGGNGKCVL